MALPVPIPGDSPYPSHVGFGTGFTLGWAVWAHQRAFNRFHDSFNDVEDRPIIPDLLDEDFTWGQAEEEACKRIQHLLHLDEDGVSGMDTQKRIVKYFCGDIPVSWGLEPAQIYRARYGRLPDNLLYSISYGEAVYWLGITNHNSPTNIDLGPFQDNVRGEALNDLSRVQQGFDVRYQVSKKWSELIKWYDENHARPGCSPPDLPASQYPERIWRRACMAHNRPLDAAVLARFPLNELNSDASRAFEREWVGLSEWNPDPWNVPLNWVLDRGCKFPNGHPVETRLEWDRFYALSYGKPGTPGYWPGLVTRFVKNWAPQVPQ